MRRVRGAIAGVRGRAVRAVPAVALAAVLAAAASCRASGATYTFRLVNRDTVALDSASVGGGAVEARFGTVPPGGEARASVVVRRDAILRLSGLRGGLPLRFFLGGYASRGPDAEVVLTVTPGPALQIGAATPR